MFEHEQIIVPGCWYHTNNKCDMELSHRKMYHGILPMYIFVPWYHFLWDPSKKGSKTFLSLRNVTIKSQESPRNKCLISVYIAHQEYVFMTTVEYYYPMFFVQ